MIAERLLLEARSLSRLAELFDLLRDEEMRELHAVRDRVRTLVRVADDLLRLRGRMDLLAFDGRATQRNERRGRERSHHQSRSAEPRFARTARASPCERR